MEGCPFPSNQILSQHRLRVTMTMLFLLFRVRQKSVKASITQIYIAFSFWDSGHIIESNDILSIRVRKQDSTDCHVGDGVKIGLDVHYYCQWISSCKLKWAALKNYPFMRTSWIGSMIPSKANLWPLALKLIPHQPSKVIDGLCFIVNLIIKLLERQCAMNIVRHDA